MNNGYINFPDITGYGGTIDSSGKLSIKIQKNTEKGIQIKEFFDASLTKMPMFNGSLKFPINSAERELKVNAVGSVASIEGGYFVNASVEYPVGTFKIFVIDYGVEPDYTILTFIGD